ncbi:F-box protein At3g07870-like [Syzygium oleosum]|uniref:F-box protein At3g07870-like n=1 Tax=Syzygium oleosum TaxID=219896 RepID=UPI0011D26D02|nr:F-box protein At3g07870-like [Syzygium oleosum]
MSSSSDDDPQLPHDVAVEVLKRLPVESLLRFRCVSRSWRSTIDDPRFVALHLRHSAVDASRWYLLCRDWCGPVQNLCSLLSHESLALPSRSQTEIPFVTTPPGGYRIVGSCNGLICVTECSRDGYGRAMHLWNPFTRKHKAVRRPGPDTETGHMVLGFAFDARSIDYKIVRILHSPDDCFSRFGRVEIYSHRTDSWRSLEGEAPAFRRQDNRAVFLNGNLHWFASYRKEGGYGSIVSFDVAGEVFDGMALLEEIFPVDSVYLLSCMYMAVLNDSLAVFINGGEALDHPDSDSVCSVWVMRDYGVPESWTKLYTFEASRPVVGFDGFTWNGELLIEISGGERLSWNPITGQIANLPSWRTCDLFTVVESLVSL